MDAAQNRKDLQNFSSPVGPVRKTKLVYEFENRGRGRVASPIASLHEAGVAAIAIFEAGTDVVEQVLDEIFAIQQALAGQNLLLLEIRFSGKFFDGLGAAAAVANEDLSGLAASNQGILSG
jgi:hypothetical protein